MFNTNHHHINNIDESDNSVNITQPISGTFTKKTKKSFTIICTVGDKVCKNIFSFEPTYTFTSKFVSQYKEVRDYSIQWHSKNKEDMPPTKQIPIWEKRTIDVEIVQFMLMNDNKIAIELIELPTIINEIPVIKYKLTKTEQKLIDRYN